MNRLTKQISLVLISSSLVLHGCERLDDDARRQERPPGLPTPSGAATSSTSSTGASQTHYTHHHPGGFWGFWTGYWLGSGGHSSTGGSRSNFSSRGVSSGSSHGGSSIGSSRGGFGASGHSVSS